jgi:hypothetical protein
MAMPPPQNQAGSASTLNTLVGVMNSAYVVVCRAWSFLERHGCCCRRRVLLLLTILRFAPFPQQRKMGLLWCQ